MLRATSTLAGRRLNTSTPASVQSLIVRSPTGVLPISLVCHSTLDDLASAAKSGGRRQMNALLRELRPLVCRWALMWTGSPDVAEDVAQRTLVRVYRSFGRYAPKGKITTWVYHITRNNLVDLNRTETREQDLRDSMQLDALTNTVSARAEEPINLLAASDLLRRVMGALTVQQRVVLDLADLQGFNSTEVAEMLDLAPATVRVHRHHARRVLLAEIEKLGDGK